MKLSSNFIAYLQIQILNYFVSGFYVKNYDAVFYEKVKFEGKAFKLFLTKRKL